MPRNPNLNKTSVIISLSTILFLSVSVLAFTVETIRQDVTYYINTRAGLVDDEGIGTNPKKTDEENQKDFDKFADTYSDRQQSLSDNPQQGLLSDEGVGTNPKKTDEENQKDFEEFQNSYPDNDGYGGEKDLNNEDYDDCMKAYNNPTLCQTASKPAVSNPSININDYNDCMKAYNNPTLCQTASKPAVSNPSININDYNDCMKAYNNPTLCQTASKPAVSNPTEDTNPPSGIKCSNSVSSASCFCTESTCFWNDNQNHTYSIPGNEQAYLNELLQGLADYGVLHESYSQLSIDWNKDGVPDIPLSILFYESTQQILGFLRLKSLTLNTPAPIAQPTFQPATNMPIATNNPTSAPVSTPQAMATNAPNIPIIPSVAGLIYFSQLDPRWADVLIGPDQNPFYTLGCGETVLASLLASYIDPNWDPIQAYNTFWKDDPHWNEGWSSIYFLADILKEYNFNPTEDRKDWDIFGQILSSGNLGLIYGTFGPTNTPHITLATTYYLDPNGLGHFILQDPYINGGGANGKLDCVRSGSSSGSYLCTDPTGEVIDFTFMGKYVLTPP